MEINYETKIICDGKFYLKMTFEKHIAYRGFCSVNANDIYLILNIDVYENHSYEELPLCSGYRMCYDLIHKKWLNKMAMSNILICCGISHETDLKLQNPLMLETN